ncbi:hypothetical protein [Aurantimonas sp. VKM B-3413]|uniref:hypothetical protein n=1 Tax=Aurantimonas sp. VKM B-3413 TaxID=2779401 RepID=UPI001E555FAC|nr:hypothetical protein [Aurantimonas sp. VKM B-3413]MCB8835987.1 hypothetical protein [Aurantimonas sp. VKM B-3413]
MSVEDVIVRGGGRFIHSVSSVEQNWDTGHGRVTYEVAIIHPNNEDGKPEDRRLAMRWHGSGPSGRGFPNTFGKPTWFEVDPQLEMAILNSLCLSAKQYSEALTHLSRKN